MNFLGMGPGELMVIMVLALIVFGPQKLPEIGQGLGKAIGEFRRATSQITDEINRELTLDAQPKPQTPATPAPAALPPAAPVETSISGQTQDGPLVLEIKPPTASTTFENAPLDETPPMAPEEVQAEPATAYAPVEAPAAEPLAEAPAQETAGGAPAAAPSGVARAERARRTRKPASTTPETNGISETSPEEAPETANS